MCKFETIEWFQDLNYACVSGIQEQKHVLLLIAFNFIFNFTAESQQNCRDEKSNSFGNKSITIKTNSLEPYYLMCYDSG